MTGGVPSIQTYERIFSPIHPKELETILTDFYEKQKSLNVLNAYSNKYGIFLASEMILDKTNSSLPFLLF